MCESLGEPDETGLARHDMSPAGGAAVAGHPADIHDRRTVASLEMRQREPRAEERAIEDEADDRAKLGQIHLAEWALRTQGGVVDDDVEPAEPGY